MKTPYALGRTLAPVLVLAVTTGCGDGTGVLDSSSVELAFRVTAPGSSLATAPAAVPGHTSGPSLVAGPPLTIAGTNGSLTISEVRLIVAEVELEGEDDACEVASGSDDCADFEAPPSFLDLPLDGEPIDVMTGVIPPGVYDELEFEIEDLEDDEEDSTSAAAIEALRSAIRDEFPDWPEKASALLVGTFTATDGAATPFRVYVDAEIEIEMDLSPPLVVGEDGGADRALTVDIEPHAWFVRADGSVLPLHEYDYARTGELLELEVELEEGFTEIEIG